MLSRPFSSLKVEDWNQCVITSGSEQLEDEPKLFIKVMNNPKVIAAVRTMKSENTFLRKPPAQKKNLYIFLLLFFLVVSSRATGFTKINCCK